jgi:pyrimidine oxygenase
MHLLSAGDENSSLGANRPVADHDHPRDERGFAQLDVGVFIPIGNNGWIISATSPQYMPTFDLNRTVVQKAERYGLDFALSMIKLHGYGGPTEYWDYNLESFTLMAGLAAVTERIKLMASVAVLTLPPALVARMAVTIDSIAPGRFGVNIVSGWQKAEYDQMGLWPGDEYFGHRYDYSSEFVAVMKELWEKGQSNLKGRFFTMNDCRLLPHPSESITIVSAGQSERGMRFVADYCDYSFVATGGLNNPTAIAPTIERLNQATAGAGRTIGALVLIMIIADETDEAAMAKLQLYNAGADFEALAWMGAQSAMDKKASAESTAVLLANAKQNARPSYLQTLCGSYATIAAQLDEIAAIDGIAGVMLAFDDFVLGMDQFGRHIQPLMKSRASIAVAEAV